MPAVSKNLNSTPFKTIVSSITSLVVPAISETMALSSFNKTFNNVDLPALGEPTMATGIPFLITFPNENESSRLFVLAATLFTRSTNCWRSANSTSSSLKSNSSSTNDAKFNNSCLNTLISSLKPPLIWCIATWCAALEFAEIKSAMASVCDKSILPFKKARKENSPGPANRAPLSNNRARIFS